MQIPRADVRKNVIERMVPQATFQAVPHVSICSQLGDCGVFGWREDEGERVRHLGGNSRWTYVYKRLGPSHTLSPLQTGQERGVLPRAGTWTTPKRTAHCRSRILIRTLSSTVDRPGRPGATKSGTRKKPARPHRGIQSESCQSC
jgi:hypothetical protein